MLHPDVISVHKNDNSALYLTLELRIPSGLSYFRGHFPGLPILPGVVQIDWAVYYARKYLPLTGSFSALENIKFQSLVLPNQELELILSWDSEKKYLEFKFATSQCKYSSGRIVFGGTA